VLFSVQTCSNAKSTQNLRIAKTLSDIILDFQRRVKAGRAGKRRLPASILASRKDLTSADSAKENCVSVRNNGGDLPTLGGWFHGEITRHKRPELENDHADCI
jgi:hypothetical protein